MVRCCKLNKIFIESRRLPLVLPAGWRHDRRAQGVAIPRAPGWLFSRKFNAIILFMVPKLIPSAPYAVRNATTQESGTSHRNSGSIAKLPPQPHRGVQLSQKGISKKSINKLYFRKIHSTPFTNNRQYLFYILVNIKVNIRAKCLKMFYQNKNMLKKLTICSYFFFRNRQKSW